MQTIRYRGSECLSLKQLDELNSLPKGSSFRLFKRAALVEGEDFHLLDHSLERELIEALRGAGLIYATSRNVVLITRRGYERLWEKPL